MRSFAPARLKAAVIKAGNFGSMTARSRAGSADHDHRTAQPWRPLRPDRKTTIDPPDPLPSFDAWIQRNEFAARSQFSARAAALNSGETGGWFDRMLDRHILPVLDKIGFDKILARSVMALAAPAWKAMGPPPASGIRIDPALTRKIDQIRSSTKAVSRQEKNNRNLLHSRRPAELISLAGSNADPAGLTSLLERVTASWLILPRAYRSLNIDDSRCLPVYLAHLESEQDPAFRKVLSRVTIEFIANFTRKYRQPALSDENTSALLFFGFAAMFWKNLRQPPAGRQDDMISDHYFQWARKLREKNSVPSTAMDMTAAFMYSARQRIFPQPDAFGRVACDSPYHPEPWLIALRNGKPGIAAALSCLGPSANLYKDATAARIPYTQVPTILQSLLRTVAEHRKTESHTTAGNIRRFLTTLADRYRVAWQNAEASEDPTTSVLRFTAPRTIAMIQSFHASSA